MSAEPIAVSVVLPCLNEEAAIGAVIDEAHRGIEVLGLRGEVIVVDNGSTDRSRERAEEHGARVVPEAVRGYGSAYLAGLNAARGEVVVMADADGTYPLDDLGSFVRPILAGADLVLGSRLRGEIAPGSMPWLHRRIGNPVLTAVLNRFFGVRVSDAHCGLRAIRRSAVPTLELRALGMEFASEMIVKAAKRHFVIQEVPIDYRRRTGDSKLRTFRDGWRHLRFLLVHSPTYLFLLPGGVLLAAGLVVLGALATGPITLFGRSWEIHTMIAGSTATLLGAQTVQLGLFARTYAVLYLGERDPLFTRLWPRVRLEHGLLIGALLVTAGGGLLLAIAVSWAVNGFGPLGASHPALLGMTLFGLGVQAIFGSFFLSILGLRVSPPSATSATGALQAPESVTAP